MIMALLIGRGGSVGFPNKNVFPILGRPLMSYPLSAALHSKYIDEVFEPFLKDVILTEFITL